MSENTWPNGTRHTMYPDEHERWNENNYPGTKQLCNVCDEPTGRCEDDSILTEDGEPLCEACFYKQECETTEHSIPREYGVSTNTGVNKL